ncbi:hypothetical protein ACREYP_04775 [Enterobacter sp. TMH.L2]
MSKPTYEELETTVTNLTAQVQGLATENAELKEIFDSVTNLENEPEYHEAGMGCGLEDRGITDRYEAMRHGWDCAMERVYGEVIPCAEEFGFKATDAALAEIRNEARAEGVDMLADHLACMNINVSETSVREFADKLRKEQGK